MRAAIYARVSKDDEGKSDSVPVQLSECRELAAQQGLTVVTEFSDDGISGYARGNRPGFLSLMQAVAAREIDVILFRDVDRIARGPDLPVICREAEFAQVLLIGMDKTDSHDASFRMRVGLSAIMSSEMIEKVRVLTRLALRARAKDGHHTGGRAFGYCSVPVDPAKPGERKRLVIDEVSAAVVREVFARYARGETMKAIVEDLNARSVPSAGAGWKREARRTDNRWLVSALHAILHNETYVGRMIYGRRQFVKNPTTGKRVAREAPPSEWIVNDMPELAIVERELWDRVQARLGVNVGAAQSRAKPTYVLSGLLICGECGDKMTATGTKGKGAKGASKYQCSTNHGGGKSACPNTVSVPIDLAEQLILEPMLRRLSSQVTDAAAAALRKVKGGRKGAASARHVTPEIAKANAKIADLDRLVAAGVLSSAEARPALERARAAREVAERGANDGDSIMDLAKVAEDFKGWAGMLRRALGGADIPQAREALRQMGGRITLRLHTERGERRALRPDQTLDGKGIAAGTWEDRYYVAHFEHSASALPLHPVLAAEWFRAAAEANHQLVAGTGFVPATFGL
jgi:site-specific DNA recombinase